MDEFEIIKHKDRYDELSASEKHALKDLCDNEQSFAQIKSLMQHAEGVLPISAPEHVHEKLLTLYDTTYPVKHKGSPKSFPLYWYAAAAAAVLLVVFLLYPLTQHSTTATRLAKKEEKNNPVQQASHDTVKAPAKLYEEKPVHHNPQPLIAKTEPPSLASQEDIQNPSISQVDQVKEGTFAIASIVEEDEVSKTAHEAIAVEQELLISKNMAKEWADDRKDKANSSKSKKWVTPSMLKNIRPVF